MGQWSGISDFFAMGGYAQYVWAPTEWFSLFYLRSVRAGAQKTESGKELLMEARAHQAEEDL